jgi:hypothetical protein
MTKRKTPRGAYSPAMRRLILRRYGSDRLTKIERILGRPAPDPKLREALAKALWHYVDDTKTAGRAVPAEVNRRIKRVEQLTRSLRDELRALIYGNDPSAGEALLRIGIGDVNALLDQLETLSLLNDAIPPEWWRMESAGRPVDRDLYILMGRVVDIFETMTGREATVTTNPAATSDTDIADVKNAYSGQLMEMAALVEGAAAAVANRRPKSNSALGQMLKCIRAARRIKIVGELAGVARRNAAGTWVWVPVDPEE